MSSLIIERSAMLAASLLRGIADRNGGDYARTLEPAINLLRLAVARKPAPTLINAPADKVIVLYDFYVTAIEYGYSKPRLAARKGEQLTVVNYLENFTIRAFLSDPMDSFVIPMSAVRLMKFEFPITEIEPEYPILMGVVSEVQS
jgi:hypothetical protein